MRDDFAELDRLPAPDIWADAVTRARSRQAAVAPASITRTGPGAIAGRRGVQLRWLIVVAAIALLLAVVMGGLAVGDRDRSMFVPVISPGPTDGRSVVTPTPTPTGPTPSAGVTSPYIAFVRTLPDRSWEQWAIRADGSDAQRLSVTGLTNIAWSPDGRRLLVVRDYRIYLADVTDDGIGPFVDTGFDTGGERACRRKSGHPMPCQDAAFTFAPDGQRIAFIQRCTWSVPGCMFITTLDLRTGERTELTSTIRGARRPMALPAWAPDGSRLVFTRETNQRVMAEGGTPRSALYIVGADGTGLHRLDLGDLRAQAPAWSPDGQTIAFMTESWEPDGSNLQQDIYTVRPDGSDLRRLTTDGASAWPEWTAEGRIRFRRGIDGARPSVAFWSMDPDGSDARSEVDLAVTWGEIVTDIGWIGVPGDPGRSLFWQPLP